MSSLLDFRFHAERTPNPQSLKWVVSKDLTPPGVTANFQAPVGADVSPLAARLFAIADVTGVFVAPGFVTVTKREGREWTELAQPIVDALKAFAASDESALGPAFSPADRSEESGVVARIKEILENEVRPAVARDGGDVVFAGFHDGVVEVVLQGSCVGCPSSTATLRFGIEGRLREEIPEVIKVIQV
ncbi:MAG: NifU family protein [Deltaproteobacteria bacterium]|nr:NifU family protein [Deltaproteobacteria bacterium]